MKNKAEYIKAIKQMVKIEGLEMANIANHKALETGLVNLEMFQAAARELAKIILAR